MKNTYDGIIKGNNFKVITTYTEKYYDDDSGNYDVYTTTTVYKNGDFWGSHNKSKTNSRVVKSENYKLTTGNELNFHEVVNAILNPYFDAGF